MSDGHFITQALTAEGREPTPCMRVRDANAQGTTTEKPCLSPVTKTEAEEAWEQAQTALTTAQELPRSPERFEALKRAGKLRLKASNLLLATQ